MDRYIILIFIMTLFLISCKNEEPGPNCPLLCADDDICTNDYCSEYTDFKCVHDVIPGCCTTSKDCSGDKPDCVGNECSDDRCELPSDCPVERLNCIHGICYEFECMFTTDCGNEKCVDGKCV